MNKQLNSHCSSLISNIQMIRSLLEARFEDFTVVKIQVKVFWVVTLCSVAIGN